MANSAIFRTTGAGENEGTVSASEKIEFNEAVVEDSDQIVTRTEFEMSRAFGKQSRIRKTFSHKIEDTGFQGLDPVITGVIRTANIEETEYKIKRWMLEDQFNSNYKHGRFGLRLDDNPVFNVTPVATRGYFLERIKLIRSGSHRGKLEFIAFLRYDGAIGTPNGSGEYRW